MQPSEFFEFIKKWKDLGKYPPSGSWPMTINFGKDVWDPITKLYKYTKSNNYEYETSFFFADGDIVTTPPFKGERTQVNAKHKLKVEYVPSSGDFFDKLIFLDDKVVKKIPIKKSNLPKNIKAGYLFNVHTHPVHYLDKRTGGKYDVSLDMQDSKPKNVIGKFKELFFGNSFDPSNLDYVVKTYGFFSDTDIRSLISSNAIVSGLVTEEFWLACKTDKTISQIETNGEEMLQRISNSAYSGDKYLEDLILKEMQNWGIVFYRGRFGSSIRRVN